MAQAAEALGLYGVGRYDNKKFTHIDTRPASNRAFWHYNSVGVMKYVATFSDCPYTEPAKALQYGDTGAGGVLQSIAIGVLIANEGISILENCAKYGIPIPERLLKALEQIKGEET